VLFAALAALSTGGCSKREKEQPINVPPPQGAASTDELSTGIGQARGLSSALAPTSTRWQRAFVLDDKRAILTGEIETASIALVTGDAGRTWRSLRREREGWSTWSVGEGGVMALAVGPRASPSASGAPQRRGPADAALSAGEAFSIAFAPFDASDLSAASPIALPALPSGARAPAMLSPAVLSAESAAVLLEPTRRPSLLAYVGRPGAQPAPMLSLPPQERVIAVPYGRPPTLLSVRGREFLMRHIPAPGRPLDAAQIVAGLVMTPAAVRALSTTPACDFGSTSMQIVPQPADKAAVIVVSATQATVLTLPGRIAERAALGCSGERLIIEVLDPKSGEPALALCSLDGSCVVSEKPPFRPWLEPHEGSIVSVPTREGAAAVLTSRAAARWGLYIAQSPDGGRVYGVPRVIGEGTGERGRIELGALLPFGNRLVLLLQADVTGTSRRGWYIAASEDGGLTWSPP
jgi:hypothetical protein